MLGKIDAPLNKKLQNVEWGEYKLGDLFEIATGRDVIIGNVQNGNIPLISHQHDNNGISKKIAQLSNRRLFNFKNTLPLADRGVFLATTQNENFHIGTRVKALTFKDGKKSLKIRQFIVACINKLQILFLDYASNATDNLPNFKIQLPIKNGKIDFEFMESFISEMEAERITELEAYLSVCGLKDYTLTAEEQRVLVDFEKGKIAFGGFTYKSIFNKIVQGRRLKKDDQISGNIPFVMAGITNTGVVNYISNPVASFPKNSITIDIFGNTFYRNYDFGAGDDTGVYWNNEKKYSKETMLFFAASMEKSISGKFDFGKKLRSSQSLNFTMKLPAQNKQPNYAIMETFISAIQKLVIKDVVLYADRKIAATKAGVIK